MSAESAITSFGIAYRSDGSTATAHIQKDGAPKALCGQTPVIFCGEVEAPDFDFDTAKHCALCWKFAGPDVTSLWDGSSP